MPEPQDKGSPPWAQLRLPNPGRFRARLPDVSAAVIEAVAAEVPDYAGRFQGAFGVELRRGVEVALGRFLELPGTAQPALQEAERDVYERLGRQELRAGRRLDALLSAYRVGARVTFRGFADLAREEHLDATHVVLLAESLFVYIDELSAVSAQGYAAEQVRRAGDVDRRREELLVRLLAGTLTLSALEDAARLAQWPVPDAVVVVVAPGLDEISRLGVAGALLARTDLGAVAVLEAPQDDRERAALTRRLRGARAAVGPVTALGSLLTSARQARRALDLVEAGTLTDPPVWVDDHLSTLLVHQDAELLEAFATRRLAPLQTARPGTRKRLAETLLAWLEHRGEWQTMARYLHVHPQTVGYRIGQLRELFGDVLDDPTARFELELVLRAAVLRPALLSDLER